MDSTDYVTDFPDDAKQNYKFLLQTINNRVSRLEEDHKTQSQVIQNLVERNSSPEETNIVTAHILEFCSNLNFPCFKYTLEDGRRRHERALWKIVLLLSLLVSSKYILDAYQKWQASPIIISFNDSLTPVGRIPFPAVTICTSRPLAESYPLDELRDLCWNSTSSNCTAENLESLLVASLLCPHSTPFSTKLKDNSFVDGSYNDDDELTASCNEDFQEVWFSGLAVDDCSKYLQKIFVDEQMCFTFNMLPTKALFRENVKPAGTNRVVMSHKLGWTLDQAYNMASNERTVPFYYSRSGPATGLHLVMEPRPNTHENSCEPKNSGPGYTLYFHPPGEIPWNRAHLDRTIHIGTTSDFVLKPSLVTTADDLRAYNPTSRKCVFDDERRLSLFTHYTQNNCHLECRVNCTFRMCGCVPFYLPRPDSSTPVCGIRKRKCGYAEGVYSTGYYSWEQVNRAYPGLFRESLIHEFKSKHEKLYEADRDQFVEEFLKFSKPDCSCYCPPSCTTLRYETEGSVNPLQNYKNRSSIYIYFKEDEYTSVVRKELISFTDFIANSGGVLGVFCGISFLTLAELLYFLTFRLWGSIKNSWLNGETSRKTIVEQSPQSKELLTVTRLPSSMSI